MSTTPGSEKVQGGPGAGTGGGLGSTASTELHGCMPLLMESTLYDPHTGSGLARRAEAVCALPSGDVAVRLLAPAVGDLLAGICSPSAVQVGSYIVLGSDGRLHQGWTQN